MKTKNETIESSSNQIRIFAAMIIGQLRVSEGAVLSAKGDLDVMFAGVSEDATNTILRGMGCDSLPCLRIKLDEIQIQIDSAISEFEPLAGLKTKANTKETK